jgi:hypothetical protein
LLSGAPAFGQKTIETGPPPLGPEEGRKAGRALVADLLAQPPETNTTNTGVVKVRDENDREREIPV